VPNGKDDDLRTELYVFHVAGGRIGKPGSTAGEERQNCSVHTETCVSRRGQNWSSTRRSTIPEKSKNPGDGRTPAFRSSQPEEGVKEPKPRAEKRGFLSRLFKRS
jgi:hypothetical protein